MLKPLLIGAGLLAMSGSPALAQPRVTFMDFHAEAISADGRVVVGEEGGGGQPYYWSQQTGRVAIPVPNGANPQTRAFAVSGDGSAICGTAIEPVTGTFRGWYWTQAAGAVLISIPGSSSSQATCISRDGLTISGAAVNASTHQYQGFAWTADDGGRTIPGGVNYATWVHALSPSGLRAVGSGSSGGGTWPMFWGSTYVWCESLGVIPGQIAGYAIAMTPDSSTVVGHTMGNGGSGKALVWTAQDGLTAIDPLPPSISAQLEAVSDDGRVAGGHSPDSINSGLIWRKGVGLMRSTNYFNLMTGVTVNAAGPIVGISANGRVICTEHAVVDLGACGSADFNHDGDSGTDADIEAFFACLAGNCCPLCDSADFNYDGDSGTDADIEAFFRVLAGGNC